MLTDKLDDGIRKFAIYQKKLYKMVGCISVAINFSLLLAKISNRLFY